MDEHFLWQEEDLWKCRKHPSSSRRRNVIGVCPSCVRDRLLLLCPDCANLRPCPCFPAPSSSSSSSSSISSVDQARSSVSGAIGAVGRVSTLIETEPPFRRSRSVAFPFRRREPSDRGRRGGFWFFSRKKEEEFANYSRSRSVANCSDGGSGDDDGKGKGWKWHFPSPMRAFRHRKSARVVHERSTLCRV